MRAAVRRVASRPSEADFQAYYGSGTDNIDLEQPFRVAENGADGGGSPVQVTMRRAFNDPTPSQALWTLIRQTTNALSFENYEAFILVLGGAGEFVWQSEPRPLFGQGRPNLPWRLPFPGVEPTAS